MLGIKPICQLGTSRVNLFHSFLSCSYPTWGTVIYSDKPTERTLLINECVQKKANSILKIYEMVSWWKRYKGVRSHKCDKKRAHIIFFNCYIIMEIILSKKIKICVHVSITLFFHSIFCASEIVSLKFYIFIPLTQWF